MLINRRQILLIFLLSGLWTALLHNLGSEHHTFAEKWKDNVSNISSAYFFKYVGLDIYKIPASKLATPINNENAIPPFPKSFAEEDFYRYDNSQPLFFTWANVPRPYPLGAWIVYSPFAWLFYGAGFSLNATTLLMAFTFYLMAHLCFFTFYNIFRESLPAAKSKVTVGLKYFVLGLCYYEFMRWSGQGQFDVFGLYFVLLTVHFYKKECYQKVLLFYGISLFFHFRALLLLGLTLLVIFRMLKPASDKNFLFNPKTLHITGVSVLLGLIAIIIFYWNFSYLSDPSLYTNNNYSFRNLLDAKLSKQIYYLFVTWGIVLWFGLKKKWDLMVTAASINLMFAYTPLMRGWYVLFIFPIFLLLDKRSMVFKQDIIAVTLCYIFIASTYPSQSPFDFTFFRELYELWQ
jgi:uncharacterized membrane protein